MITNINKVPEFFRNEVEPHTTKSGLTIYLNKSWNHCYIGDYEAKLHFSKILTYGYKNIMMDAKHGDLEKVLSFLESKTEDGEIFCDAYKGHYRRRKKAVEKAGFQIIRSNAEQIEWEHDRISFIIKKA